MKKLIHKNQPTIANRVSTSLRVLGMMIFLAMSIFATAQVDCDVTMACNDGIQVSLNENCEAEITPDMMLEDPAYDESAYTVTLTDMQGNELPTNVVDYSHVNQSFSVNVELNGCSVSCWGTITIEDKLPPLITGCEDVVLACGADLVPGNGDVVAPIAADACSNSTLEYSDESETNACADDYVITVTRTWTATDEQGNESTCVQLLLIERATVADVTFPENYDDVENPAFSCSANFAKLENGAPAPSVTGTPIGAACPNIQTYYEDIIFDICGASKKILRQWVVVDWCTGEERAENQVIKILDTEAPVCASNTTLEVINTENEKCTGNYVVPAPNVTKECSEYTYTVGYKLMEDGTSPYDDVIYDNVVYNPTTQIFTITDLPQDTSWVVYTLTDACGNSSQCYREVYVKDNQAPTPVCEGYTVVGLEDQGWADIFATSIDDGSFDNCAVVKYEVKRESTPCGFSEDLQFGEKVNFCCEDVDAGYVKVALRVYDAAGNYNDCIVNVSVQDKINPTIQCPANITIQCTQDYNDFNLTGEAVGFDNCSVEITHSDFVNLNDCGLGKIRRTWKAEDPQGRSATCVQTITVSDNNPFGVSDIVWPSDLEINDCTVENATPELLNSLPVLYNVDCANIAISYDDNVFYNAPDYCIKVLRHWKIVDWCNYDPQNPSFFEYTQKIGFYNNVVPTFAFCDDLTFTSTNGDCQEDVSIVAIASDDCTPAAQLKYTYTLDLNNDGSIEYNGVVNSVNRTMEVGTHKLVWTVTDACDNTTTCEQLIIVRDDKAPTPICLGEVTWVLGEDGNTEVWASDFDLKSEAGCGSVEDLIFSFNEAGTQQALTFSCTDIPNGIAAEIPLKMYVIDASGNSEYCDVTLILQDSENTNACFDSPSGNLAMFAGRIINTDSEGMANIGVELQDMQAQDTDMHMTEVNGDYTFEGINYYGDYVIAPTKDDDTKNGVSTLDLVMVQRHILGLQALDSPYKLIAADVNGNEKISASDLLALRKVILGVTTSFGDNTSWRFIPTTYEIEDPTDPFGFPEKIQISDLYLSEMNIDFTAIKTGDVNGSVSYGLQNEEISTTRTAKQLAIENVDFVKNDKVSIPVMANDVSEMIGMQFAMDIDAALDYTNIQSGVLNITEEHVSFDRGTLMISWSAAEAISMNQEDVLFTIDFVANENRSLSEVVALNTEALTAEVYDAGLVTSNLDFEIGSRTEIATQKTALYQNSPNPFKGMTSVGFDLAEEGLATIAIFDIAGKELYRVTNVFPKGYNEMSFDIESMGATSGILYYTLSAGEFIDTKKMIILK